MLAHKSFKMLVKLIFYCFTFLGECNFEIQISKTHIFLPKSFESDQSQ